MTQMDPRHQESRARSKGSTTQRVVKIGFAIQILAVAVQAMGGKMIAGESGVPLVKEGAPTGGRIGMWNSPTAGMSMCLLAKTSMICCDENNPH